MDIDPELKKQLSELLISLLKNAQDAGAWATTQIPILVQEKIAYGRALESAELGLSLLLLGFGLLLLRRAYADEKFTDIDDWDAREVLRTFAGVVTGGIGFLALLVNTPTFLQVWFAPRLYIVDWLIELVKQAKA